MKHSIVIIPWKKGLHLRPAAKIMMLAQRFQSSIILKVNLRLANAKSLLAMLLLSTTFETAVNLEVSGTDEEAAFKAMDAAFESKLTGHDR